MKKLMTVKVVKRRWQRGEEESGLRMDSGKQCCIGFVARKLGATVNEITNIPTLESLEKNERCRAFASIHEDTLSTVYFTNDDTTIKDPERITTLKELGKRMGIRFTFV